jgi:hypothetical protein
MNKEILTLTCTIEAHIFIVYHVYRLCGMVYDMVLEKNSFQFKEKLYKLPFAFL